jgi:PAS domain S-box-containing protein
VNPTVNILLVDDEARNLDALESILQSPGYNLVRALTGSEALLRLLEGEFAAMVLDVHMPAMSGIELADLIKQRKRTQHIPIIFLTAYFQEDKQVLEGYGIGAVDYLTKPVNPQILRSKIGVFTDLFRKTRAVAATNAALELEVGQRQNAEEALRQANNELEARVRARTAELIRVNEELRAREMALRRSEARFHAIVTQATAGIAQTDLTGKFTLVNLRFCEIVGRPAEELLGLEMNDITHPDDLAASMQRFAVLAAGGTDFSLEKRYLRPDGSSVWVSKSLARITDSEGVVLGFVAVSQEISERKRLEDLLVRHANELEAQVTARTAELRETIGELEAFSYSVSHDLRSPLRAMQGFAQLVLKENADKLDPLSVRYLEGINHSAARMDALIADVLTYARLVRSELKLQPVNLDDLVPQIVSSYPQLQENGAEIEIEGPLQTVLANEANLTQCLSNLLSNAVKFVAPGVRPHVRVHADEIEGSHRLWIEDNGIGIAAADQARIWGMFTRIGRPKDYDGTGIGLAIVRKAVERMNGQIGLESVLGQGSKFWLRLMKA